MANRSKRMQEEINNEVDKYLRKYAKKHIEIIDDNKNGSAILLRHIQDGQPFSKVPYDKRRPHRCHQPFWINKQQLLFHLRTLTSEPIFKKITSNPVLVSSTICSQCWNSYDKYLKLVNKFENEEK